MPFVRTFFQNCAIRAKISLNVLIRIRVTKFKSSPFVIFDSAGSNLIAQCLPENSGYSICSYIRQSDLLLIDLRIIFHILTTYLDVSQYAMLHKIKLSKSRKLFLTWHIACLRLYSPKVVVTFIDNDIRFHLIAKISKIPSLAIQNGARWFENRNRNNFQMPLYAVFGENEYKIYPIDVQASVKFIPVGSVRLALARKFCRQGFNIVPKFSSLLLISGYNNDLHSGKYPELLKSLNVLTSILSSWLTSSQTKLTIAGATADSWELDYFRNHLPADVFEFFPNGPDYFSSYQLLFQHQVVIGTTSTLMLEALAITSCKVIICNFSGNPSLNIPYNYPFTASTSFELLKILEGINQIDRPSDSCDRIMSPVDSISKIREILSALSTGDFPSANINKN